MNRDFVVNLVWSFISGIVGGTLVFVVSHWYGSKRDRKKRNLDSLNHSELILVDNLNMINLNLVLLGQVSKELERPKLPNIRFLPLLTTDMPTLVSLSDLRLRSDLDKLNFRILGHNFAISEYVDFYPEFRRLAGENKLSEAQLKTNLESNIANLKSVGEIFAKVKLESQEALAKVRVVREQARPIKKQWQNLTKSEENTTKFDKKWQAKLRQIQAEDANQSKPVPKEP